jgi:hypothetical protein
MQRATVLMKAATTSANRRTAITTTTLELKEREK